MTFVCAVTFLSSESTIQIFCFKYFRAANRSATLDSIYTLSSKPTRFIILSFIICKEYYSGCVIWLRTICNGLQLKYFIKQLGFVCLYHTYFYFWSLCRIHMVSWQSVIASIEIQYAAEERRDPGKVKAKANSMFGDCDQKLVYVRLKSYPHLSGSKLHLP